MRLCDTCISHATRVYSTVKFSSAPPAGRTLLRTHRTFAHDMPEQVAEQARQPHSYCFTNNIHTLGLLALVMTPHVSPRQRKAQALTLWPPFPTVTASVYAASNMASKDPSKQSRSSSSSLIARSSSPPSRARASPTRGRRRAHPLPSFSSATCARPPTPRAGSASCSTWSHRCWPRPSPCHEAS